MSVSFSLFFLSFFLSFLGYYIIESDAFIFFQSWSWKGNHQDANRRSQSCSGSVDQWKGLWNYIILFTTMKMYKWFEMYKSDFTFKFLNNCSCTGNLMDYPNGIYSKFKFSEHYFWKNFIKCHNENYHLLRPRLRRATVLSRSNCQTWSNGWAKASCS